MAISLAIWQKTKLPFFKCFLIIVYCTNFQEEKERFQMFVCFNFTPKRREKFKKTSLEKKVTREDRISKICTSAPNGLKAISEKEGGHVE